jgi:hypothetical protein
VVEGGLTGRMRKAVLTWERWLSRLLGRSGTMLV